MGYNGYTEKRKASNERYLKKFEKPTVRMTPEEKRIIEQGARSSGKSFTRFMVDCALEVAERMGEEQKRTIEAIVVDENMQKNAKK